MMNIIVLLILSTIYSCVVKGDFIIEHSLDGGKTFRERLKFRVGREGDVSIVEEEDEVSILQSEVEDFKNLLTTNSMYTLRINSVDGRRSSPAIYATIPAVSNHYFIIDICID